MYKLEEYEAHPYIYYLLSVQREELISKDDSPQEAQDLQLLKSKFPIRSGDTLELGEIGGSTGIEYNYYWENFRPENDEAYQKAPQPKSHIVV